MTKQIESALGLTLPQLKFPLDSVVTIEVFAPLFHGYRIDTRNNKVASPVLQVNVLSAEKKSGIDARRAYQVNGPKVVFSLLELKGGHSYVGKRFKVKKSRKKTDRRYFNYDIEVIE